MVIIVIFFSMVFIVIIPGSTVLSVESPEMQSVEIDGLSAELMPTETWESPPSSGMESLISVTVVTPAPNTAVSIVE